MFGRLIIKLLLLNQEVAVALVPDGHPAQEKEKVVGGRQQTGTKWVQLFRLHFLFLLTALMKRLFYQICTINFFFFFLKSLPSNKIWPLVDTKRPTAASPATGVWSHGPICPPAANENFHITTLSPRFHNKSTNSRRGQSKSIFFFSVR